MFFLKSIRDAIYSSDYPHDVLNIILEYISDFSRISAGEYHSIHLKEDGTRHSCVSDKY